MRLTIYLTLSLVLTLALSACAGSDGTDGAQGPPGEQGPQGPPGEVDMDVLVQQLTADADFRRALAQTLINNYPEELRGPQGEVGECDCEGGKVVGSG